MSAEDAPMDAATALRRIDIGFAYDAPLRRRAEGLSWMVWGLTTAIVLLVFFDLIYGRPYYRWWWMLTAAAWPAIGLTGTASVWRLAGVARPPLSITLRRVLSVLAAGIIAMYLVHFLTFSLPERFMDIGWVFIFTTIPWAILAAVQWDRLSHGGRRVTVLLGSLMFLIVLVLDAVRPDGSREAVIAITITTLSGVPLLGGLTWLLRR